MNLETRVAAFQAQLRAYAFSPEFETAATELRHLLLIHRTQRADPGDRVRLKALALMAEYLDAYGRASEAARLLKPTALELFASLSQWPAELASSPDRAGTRRLLRQRVWCCASYAVCLLRANHLEEARFHLERLRAFVDGTLADPQHFPCHGTVGLLHYYQGVLHRNAGRLNEAAREFDGALDHIRLRLEDKQAKYAATQPERLRREAIYSQVNLARVLGFGHGGIALSRGRYVEARAWTAAAQQILAASGLEIWRRGLEVYGCCATVLTEELTPHSVPRLEAHRATLEELAAWLRGRNRRNATVAEAFAILAEVRLRQIRTDSPLELSLTGLRTRLDACLRDIYRDTGPLSATAALRLIGCLLRAREFGRCETELDRFQQSFSGQAEALAEFQTLRAELWIETGREAAARALLVELVRQKPANRAFLALAWALLAWCEQRAGQIIWAQQALASAQNSLDPVQDGFTKLFVQQIAQRIGAASSAFRGPMPYQTPDEDARWSDMAYNLTMAKLNVVEAAHRRHPDYGVEKLAALMGRGPSWLYAFLADYRQVDWVNRILRSQTS